MKGPPGLELVHSFLVVAEELSFRRGAARLNLDQSALTRRIQRLEQGLGFRLLERTTREVALTPAGQAFYAENAALLARYGEAIAAARRVAEGKAGRLCIAYMHFAATELMPSAVARFWRQHPHVGIELRYLPTQGQKLALARGEVDLGYMIGPFDHADYHVLTLATDPLYLVAPRTHPLLRKPRIGPADLAGEAMILGDSEEWGEYRRRLGDLFSAEGVALEVRLEASNAHALFGLVAAGLGVTVCPESLMGFLGRGVEARPILAPGFRCETVLVWKRLNRSSQVRAFVEVARQLTARD